VNFAQQIVEILMIWFREGQSTAGVAKRYAFQQVNHGRIGSQLPLGCRGNRGCAWVAQIAKTGALVGREEEGLVLDDRTADGAAKVVALELVPPLILGWLTKEGQGSIPASRIKDRIAYKLECAAVKCVGSRPGNNVYHGAGILSVFRAVVAGLDAEFLKS